MIGSNFGKRGSRMNLMRLLSILVALSAGSFAADLCAAVQGDERKPTPARAAQKAAEKLIREVFKEEYSKRAPEEMVALAKALLKEGLEPTEDTTTRYVLLREAREIAAKAGDVKTAFRAIDEIGTLFKIDALKMKSSTLSQAAKKAKTPAELRSLASHYLSLAEDAGDADDYKTASKAAVSAAKLAKRLTDKSLIAKASARAKHFAGLKKPYEKVKSAKRTLAKKPDDEAANRTVGRFLCLRKGDWDRGLAFLSKCGVDAVEQLAARDLNKPSDALKEAAIGDGWWDLSIKEKGVERIAMRNRAYFWYAESVGELSGLMQAQAKKRMWQIRWDRSEDGWEDYTDPSLFGMQGERGDGIVVKCGPGAGASAPLKSFPQGPFDGASVRIRFDAQRTTKASFKVEGNQRIFVFDSRTDYLYSNIWVGGEWKEVGEDAKLPTRDTIVLSVLLVNGAYVVSVDGVEKLKFKTRATVIDQLSLQVNNGPATYDNIRLHLKK